MSSSDDEHRIVVIGTGNVGGALLKQLAWLSDRPPVGYPLLRVIAVANEQGIVVHPGGLCAAELTVLSGGDIRVHDRFIGFGPFDIGTMVAAMVGQRPLTFVDATAACLTDLHLECLRRGHAVVTANKKPVTASMDVWRELMSHGPRRYRFECACGAWLPVVHLIQDLVATGDVVESVTAAPSGSLGFILSECDGLEDGSGATLRATIRRAVELGYAEPDPREDLSCADAARKALILARLSGLEIEQEDVSVEDLVPEELRGVTLDEFKDCLHGSVGPMRGLAERIAGAKLKGKVMRCLATVGPDGAAVGLHEVDAGGPFGRLSGPLNTFHIRTRRCGDSRLAVYGPGAGAEVTAAGVLADILKIVH